MNENKRSFSYSYSGATNDELELIKEKYTKKQENINIKKVRRLDKRVDFLATTISISIGLLSVAIIVNGVIWLMKDFPSVVIGGLMIALGLLVASVVPFLHSKIHSLIKAHYAPIIIALIEEIEQNKI